MTNATLTVAPSTTGVWYRDVLAGLGAPDTPTNEQALQAWHTSEGTSPSAYNWLATSGTYGQPTNGVIAPNNGNPIHSFANYQAGVNATVRTIQGYPGVVSALKQGNSLSAIYGAINSSPWCKGCQGGNYPEALASLVGNPKVAATLAAQSAGTPIPGACDNAVYLINVSPYHFINQCQARAIMGGGLIAVGAFGMFVAVALFVASGFGSKSAAQTAKRATKGAASVLVPEAAAARGAKRGASRARRAAGPTPRSAPSDEEQQAIHFERGRQQVRNSRAREGGRQTERAEGGDERRAA